MSNVSPLLMFVQPNSLIGIRPASPEPAPRKPRAKKAKPATHMKLSVERRDNRAFGRLVRVDNKTGRIEKTVREIVGLSPRELDHLARDFDRRMSFAMSLTDEGQRKEAILSAMRDIIHHSVV